MLPVRIWGIRLRSSLGVVEAFMTDKEKGVDRKNFQKVGQKADLKKGEGTERSRWSYGEKQTGH